MRSGRLTRFGYLQQCHLQSLELELQLTQLLLYALNELHFSALRHGAVEIIGLETGYKLVGELGGAMCQPIFNLLTLLQSIFCLAASLNCFAQLYLLH
jgi:hypothetical protein